MKLFTVSGAVGLAGLILALAGVRLWAQDVVVSDLAWFDPEKPGAEELPHFKKKPSPDYPEKLEKDQPGYVIATRFIDEDGTAQKVNDWASHAYFKEDYVWDRGAKFEPAKKEGKAVGTVIWYSVIFNPKSSSPKGADAQPRLLSVSPVVVAKDKLEKQPGVKDGRVTVWGKVRVDSAGVPSLVALDNPQQESFRAAVEATLSSWTFSPARKGGQAVDAEVPVAFVVMRAPKSNPALPRPEQQPSVISRQSPVFPRSLLRTRQQGEVVVQFTVDKDGSVKDASVKRSDHPDFDQPALDAVLKWKFKPAMLGGKPVATKMLVPIVFSLNNSSGSGAMRVEERSARQQANLPEQLRYDVEPKVKGLLYPVYPFQLLIDKVGGKAQVAFLVAANGKVSEVKVLSATREEFGDALAAAVSAYEFIPASKDGKPVEALLKVEHEFSSGGWTGRPSEEDLDMAALVRKHADKIEEPKSLDAPIKPVSRRAPVFPATAKSDSGEALIEVLIDKDGRARLPRVVSASEPLLGYAAAQAAAEWRFEEPKREGKAVVTHVRVPFRFGAKKSAAAPEAKPEPAGGS